MHSWELSGLPDLPAPSNSEVSSLALSAKTSQSSAADARKEPTLKPQVQKVQKMIRGVTAMKPEFSRHSHEAEAFPTDTPTLRAV